MDADNDHDDTNADNDGLLDEDHSHVDGEFSLFLNFLLYIQKTY